MKKLTPGMHIRVVSPSSSIEHIGGFEANLAATERLEKLGFTVSFSEHYLENDMLGSASIESRVADIHAAFADESVDAILATIGGFNCNELLPYLDFELIAKNPKTQKPFNIDPHSFDAIKYGISEYTPYVSKKHYYKEEVDNET